MTMTEKYRYRGRSHKIGESFDWTYFDAYNDTDAKTEFIRLTESSESYVEIQTYDDDFKFWMEVVNDDQKQ